MSAKNRNILPFLDNCAVHPDGVGWLRNVKVIFVPPNTTAHLKSLDAGIISNVKFHFRSLPVRRLSAKIHRTDSNLED